MATITCGWCKNRCHMTRYGRPKAERLWQVGASDKYLVDAAFICDGCGRMSVATWRTPYDPEDSHWKHGRGDDPGEGEEQQWSPPRGHQEEFPDVPEKIAGAASEAWTCHVAGAHRGAVMLARAAIESTAKQRGIQTGNLSAKIDKMADEGLIRRAAAVEAHEIRQTGNSSAHGDLDDVVTSEDAAEVLQLMRDVLNEVWTAPALAQRRKAAREASRQQRS